MFDLDGFKDINDSLGHSFGDKLLQLVASRWLSIVEQSAKLYRLGGDEFALVIADSGDPRHIGPIAEAMIERLHEPFDLGERTVFVGTSVGVAISPAAGSNADDLLVSVDLALYRAKAEGRGRRTLFVPAMLAEAQARNAFVSEIEQAFLSRQYELFYQPLVRISDFGLVGAEALLRWRHPQHGVLLPSLFLDALANSPVASEVGRWILQSACRQLKTAGRNGRPIDPRGGQSVSSSTQG